ncbi:MAG TPA: hypothetical protein PK919_06430 [Candidatus Aminicenantes bacterium]|nr:hypothetical protein [Candidatus Aminicenantes bacterium]
MKNKLFFGVLLTAFIFPITIHAAGAKWSAAFTGGWTYSAGGDLNDFRLGKNSYWIQSGLVRSNKVSKECEALHSGVNLNGEIRYHLAPTLHLTLSAGYLTVSGGKDADEINVQWGQRVDIHTFDSTVKSVPVIIGARWEPFGRAKLRFYTMGGIGLYFTRLYSFDREEWDDGSGPASGWSESKITANAVGFGAQGGIGIEYPLGKRVAMVLEGVGRFGRASGFDGSRSYRRSNGQDSADTGTLYFGENYSTWIQGWFPTVAVSSSAPGGANWRGVGKFSVDLSGFALRAGLRVSL